ncbi:hypothetical protein AMECASPLE_026417 [Ameca splendens]|uniref:Uncharacterized protein n=1 Tax=Ameca splendens TaxID=208324 RepID=A0ABV0YGM5_9TELE
MFLDKSRCSLRCPLSSCSVPSTLLLKRPTFCRDFHIFLCKSVSGPAEKQPPGVRSGVIYHSRLCGELTFAQAFCSAIVIDSPCLFEDTNRYNYVRTHPSYILSISPRRTTETAVQSFFSADSRGTRNSDVPLHLLHSH